MIKVIKTTVLISIIIALFGAAYAQTPDTAKADDKTDIKVLEEQVRQNDEKINDLAKDREQRIENRINEFDVKLKEQKEDLKDLINLYVKFAGVIFGIVLSLLSFIGYRTITSAVKNAIKKKTIEGLKTEWLKSYEEFSRKRGKELEERWEARFKDLEKKWSDYGDSLKKIESQKGITKIADIPPEDLKEFLNRLDQVKNEKEYSAFDWSIKAYNEAEKGNDETAMEYYARSINVNPIEISAHQNLAELKIVISENKEALEIIEKALKLDKTTEEEATLVYFKCITYKLLNNDTTEIEKEFDEILAKDFTTIWDFEAFEKWFAEAGLPPDTRKFIELKTAMLKKKKK